MMKQFFCLVLLLILSLISATGQTPYDCIANPTLCSNQAPITYLVNYYGYIIATDSINYYLCYIVPGCHPL